MDQDAPRKPSPREEAAYLVAKALNEVGADLKSPQTIEAGTKAVELILSVGRKDT